MEMDYTAELGPFNKFIEHVLIVLKHLKILKNSSVPFIGKLFETFFCSCMLSFNAILIIFEGISLKDCKDLISFTDRHAIFFHIVGFFKWLYCIKEGNSINELVNSMDKCHELCQKIVKSNSEYKMKMVDTQRRLIFFTKMWFVFVLCGTTQYCANPMIESYLKNKYNQNDDNTTKMKNLPFPAWLPTEINNDFQYIGYFIFQFIGGLGSSIGIALFDVLSTNFMMFVCIQLSCLNDALSEKVNFPSNLRRKPSAKDLKKKLINCSIHHGQILEFLVKFEKFSSPAMFVQCIQNIMTLCIVSLELSFFKYDGSVESVLNLSNILAYWVGVTMELYLYCYFAEKIYELGHNVSNSFYSCHWESQAGHDRDLTIEINKIIAFSMMHAQKKIKITGGIFYVFSMETFKSLTTMCLTNAVILRQLSEEI